MDRLVEVLKDFRLSDYEIKVLLTLITEGEMSASELAERSRIPRTSVYEVIRSLENRGLVESFGKPMKFRAIPAERLIDFFSSKLKEKMQVISEGLKELERKSKKETVSFHKGDLAYNVIEGLVKDSEMVEIYGISIDDRMKAIFEKYREKVILNLMGKSDVVHGLIFGQNTVLIFTVVNGVPNIMMGSGEFYEFYRDMVEMFKNRKPPEI
ncbi:TrmB family transcriptional regulator [Geoglobus acetivorans]|uniref:Transcriptional regulator, TrmB family n=1 Tax=Geoglobus acetivorans TaxID=565033 RepID=A0A0A7GHD2_GEOAI|nr:Transcriptional regulator, TrmB family [Geoglobus acetivorans]